MVNIKNAKELRSVLLKIYNNTHNDYKECLFSRREQLRKMNVIRSYHHEIYTEQVNKVALSSDDDKRIIMDDCIHTLAYGHYNVVQKKTK